MQVCHGHITIWQYLANLINLWLPSICQSDRGEAKVYFHLWTVVAYLIATPLESILWRQFLTWACGILWPWCNRCPCIMWYPQLGKSFFICSARWSNSLSLIVKYSPYSSILLLMVLKLTPITSANLGQLNPKCSRYSICSFVTFNLGRPLIFPEDTCGT